MNVSVKEKFDSYPDHIKPKMIELRDLIYEVAEASEGVGELVETLKWGEPAYVTINPKSGTTIRIDWKEKSPGELGLFVSCNTTLVESYRKRFAGKLTFEGDRAILLPIGEQFPKKELMICIQMALRYHLNKK